MLPGSIPVNIIIINDNNNTDKIWITAKIIKKLTQIRMRQQVHGQCSWPQCDGRDIKIKQPNYRRGVAPEGSRKLRFPDFMTTPRDGSKVVSLTHRPPLPPGNTSGTHFC